MKKIILEIEYDDTDGYKGHGDNAAELIKSAIENEIRVSLQADGVIKEGWRVRLGSNVDTSDIVAFAARHQKEYGKDITFSINKEGNDIVVVMQTVFGKFTGKGSNQKFAKVEAVKLANEAWRDDN